MRVNLTAALAALGLTLSPVAAQTANKRVSYDEAMACTSLYTVLAASVKGEPDYDELFDTASRWLLIAKDRAGRETAVSDATVDDWVSSLMTEFTAQVGDDAREAFLLEGVDVCEAKYRLISDEFDNVYKD